MNIDQIGRSSAERLHDAGGARVNVTAMLHELHRTRRRRRRERLALVAVTSACVVLGVWAVARPDIPGATPAPPAHPSPSATLGTARPETEVIVTLSGTQLVAVDPASGAAIPSLDMPLPFNEDDGAYGPRPVPFSDLRWDAEGGRLAYASPDGDYHVFDVVSGRDHLLRTCPGCDAAISPDLRTLAVTDNGDLSLVDVESGTRVTLVNGTAGLLSQPSWSDDGQSIAFLAQDSEALQVVGRDGSGLTTVLDARLSGDSGPWAPALSPDGRTIAYLVLPAPSQGGRGGPIQVMSVPSKGGVPARLFVAGTCECVGLSPGVTWSPDGQDLAITASEGLYVAHAVAGAEPRLLYPAGYGRPAWRPTP